MGQVQFRESALRHGFTREDFYELTLGRYLKIRSQRGLKSVYELLGRNLDGAYLHIVYRKGIDGQVIVFHMGEMTTQQRSRFRRLLWRRRG